MLKNEDMHRKFEIVEWSNHRPEEKMYGLYTLKEVLNIFKIQREDMEEVRQLIKECLDEEQPCTEEGFKASLKELYGLETEKLKKNWENDIYSTNSENGTAKFVYVPQYDIGNIQELITFREGEVPSYRGVMPKFEIREITK